MVYTQVCDCMTSLSLFVSHLNTDLLDFVEQILQYFFWMYILLWAYRYGHVHIVGTFYSPAVVDPCINFCKT
jgi:hypothetical protein